MSGTAVAAPERDAPGPGPTPVLELTDVTKEYEGSPPIRALDRVSMRIDAGELVAIVGPSGSGKSTLLNLIGALDRATDGELRIDGVDVTSLSDSQLSALRSRAIGFVFQQFNLISGISAVDNVAEGLLYRGVPARQRRERALDALDRVGLADRAKHRPAALSGGERQRVAIARALVGEPATILADEPTGNLDSVSGASVIGLLDDLHASGSTVVIITHDQTIADHLPRCLTMRDGRIVDERGGVR